MNPTKHAGQRFGERRALVVDRVRHFEHVFHDDAPGDAHVFRVRAVVKQQVVAKIFLAAAAVVATQARSGIGGDNAHPDAPARIHALAHGDNLAHQLVTEDRRRLNHLRMIAALPNLEVGTVGERQTDAQQNFIRGQGRHVDLLNAQIFAAVQDRRRHLRGHRDACYRFHFFACFRLFRGRRSHACAIKLFSDSAVGFAANSNPS